MDDQHTIVTFRLDALTYALPIEPIVQIIEMVTLTPIPQAGPPVAGVITVRGATVPVIDMRRHFGLAPARLKLHTPIILVRLDGHMAGLIVDEVVEVRTLRTEHIVRPADILPEALAAIPFLRGLVPGTNNTLMLLDVDRLFVAMPGVLTAADGLMQAAGQLQSPAEDAGQSAAVADPAPPAAESEPAASVENEGAL